MASKLTPLRLSPLAGSMNSRSMPELVRQDQWRELLNAVCDNRGRLSRAPGWTKFLDGFITDRDYNNEDGHDQLLSFQQYYTKLDDDDDDSGVIEWPDATYCGPDVAVRDTGRQPYTFGAEVTSEIGTKHILRGTQSRIYQLLTSKGNMRILADGLGGTADNPSIRFRHAQAGNRVFFTNNYNDVLQWDVGTGPHGCAMQSVDTVPDLITMGVRKVGVIFEFRGIIFIADTEEDGVRYGHRVRWSDSGGTSFIEDPGFSLAGSRDLDYGEKVLAGGKIGNFAYLFTTKGIWQISVSPDQLVVFAFEKMPSANETTSGCIAYSHMFAMSDDSAYYGARDGIYRFTPGAGPPERDEWIHDASNYLYDDINAQACTAHTAGFDPIRQRMFFSCAQGDDTLPSRTLILDLRYGVASKGDCGVTAFLACTPSSSPSYRDWLIENCICSEEDLDSPELQAIGFATVKEGAGKPKTDPACGDYPAYIYTDQTIVIADVGDGTPITMEDFTQAMAGDDAVCNFFDEENIADLCLECEGAPVFSFAHATDWSWKTYGNAFSRETFDYANFFEGADPVYSLDSYRTRLLKGPLLFGTSEPKTIENLQIEFEAEESIAPLDMNFSLGLSVRCEDPLNTSNRCNIEWFEQDVIPLECNVDDMFMEWPLMHRREALFFDFWIDGVGGQSSFSSLEAKVRIDPSHI